MLKRIRIRGYKSLADVDVRLEPLTVLFGPNASGKSNFFDALQLLSKLTTSRRIQDAFDPPYRGKPLESFQIGEDGIQGLLDKDVLRFSMEADIELSDDLVDQVNRRIQDLRRPSNDPTYVAGASKHSAFVRERNLRYRIEIEMFPEKGILRVCDEYLAALKVDGQPKSRSPYLEKQGNRLHLRLEGQAHPKYFEPNLDHTVLSLPHYPPHYPHLTAARREFESWLFFYFEPRERMRATTPVKEVRHIGLMGEDLAAFLNTLKALEPSQFSNVEKTLRVLMPRFTGIDVGVSSIGEVELRLIEDGVKVPARVLSEGTLRILGLLALSGAKEKPGLICFEEPENGIHPRRVQLIAELLKARTADREGQYLVTTHSSVLADLLPEQSLYAVRRLERATRIDPLISWGALARKGQIDDGLTDAGEPEKTTAGHRLLRGDFDA